MPERRMILESQGKKEGEQTIPGMSTALPERRITTGEELGTGVGESTAYDSCTQESYDARTDESFRFRRMDIYQRFKKYRR